jgi:hypothetical protein
MATSANYGLRSPLPSDSADGPRDIGNLADDVDALLSTGDVDLTAGTIQAGAPVLPAHVVRLQDLQAAQAAPGPQPINWLTDVDTVTFTPALGMVLAFDGANWIPVRGVQVIAQDTQPGSGAGTSDTLWTNTTGVAGASTPGAAAPVAPTYVRDGATGKWWIVSPRVINDLVDVDTSTPATPGQVLTWDAVGQWKPGTASGGGAQYLDDLLDVIAPAPTVGQALVWDGTNWIPQTVGTGGATVLPGYGLVEAVAGRFDVNPGAGIVVSSAADTVALDKAYTDGLYSPLAHVHDLDSLTDVDVSTVAPAANDLLEFDGLGQWRPTKGPPTEVVVQATQPAAPTADILWADTSNPQPSVAVEDRVRVAGDTMSGPLVLSGDPVQPLHAVPLQYLREVLPFRPYTVAAASPPGAGQIWAETVGSVGHFFRISLTDSDGRAWQAPVGLLPGDTITLTDPVTGLASYRAVVAVASTVVGGYAEVMISKLSGAFPAAGVAVNVLLTPAAQSLIAADPIYVTGKTLTITTADQVALTTSSTEGGNDWGTPVVMSFDYSVAVNLAANDSVTFTVQLRDGVGVSIYLQKEFVVTNMAAALKLQSGRARISYSMPPYTSGIFRVYAKGTLGGSNVYSDVDNHFVCIERVRKQ